MEDSNKVVIKINYQDRKNVKNIDTQPVMVTEWNIKRIVIALFLVVMALFVLIYLLTGETEESKEGIEKKTFIKQIQPIIKPKLKPVKKTVKQMQSEPAKSSVEIKDIGLKNETFLMQVDDIKATDKKIPLVKDDISEDGELSKNNLVVKEVEVGRIASQEGPAVINESFDSHVVRAVLTSAINNKEPTGSINIPLKVNKERATGVYYFTEVEGMKGETLFHKWQWNGKIIFERKINILGNRWRAITSKLIIYQKTGLWSVSLVNKQGNILNRIEFKVISE